MKIKIRLTDTFKISLAILPIIIILALCIKGIQANPTINDLNSEKWIQSGPFELSPERGRYALLYSFMEEKSFFFSVPVARFATPDLGYKNGKYVSLFAPGVSFLSIPGYLIGKSLGISQVGTFATVSFFAVLNILLIIGICKQLKIRTSVAIVGALCFIFATPAFAYSVSYYQHHISTFFILLSIYALYKWDNWKSLIVIWLCYISAFAVDYPNIFIMFPFMIIVLKKIFEIKKDEQKVQLSFKYLYVLPVLAAIFPIIFLGWFNKNSYDNYFQMSGTVKSIGQLDENGQPAKKQQVNLENVQDYLKQTASSSSNLNTFFETRGTLNGFYILLFSPDRGIVVFAPIILLSIIGVYFLYKEEEKYLPLLISIMLFNVLIYSMWGDVWGGWAFGSRYLVPTYAVSAIFIAKALSKLNRNYIFTLVLMILFVYSSFVNTAGAVSSNANPPKVESEALGKASNRKEKYSFDRNLERIDENGVKALAYNTKFKEYLSGMEYMYLVYGIVIFTFTAALTSTYIGRKENE